MASALLNKFMDIIGVERDPYDPAENVYDSNSYYGRDEDEYIEDDEIDDDTQNSPFRNRGDGRSGGGNFGGGNFGGGKSGSKNNAANNNNIVNLHPQKQPYVLVSAKPESVDEAQLVCDHLKERHVVIVNVEDLDARVAQRVVDFILGSVYALDGEFFDITNRIFAVAPMHVDLVSIQRDTKSKGFFSYGNNRNYKG